ncbi:MAG: class I SAM-dependent methyltransferase [Candidatus Gracilibacteria bacterium]|nr:class I SAM-dependent methyltransferase [Candidatus Gracilibacteria bacterium]
MTKVDYDNIAKNFSKSRKNMKWEEIDYFISSYLSDFENKDFLDIGCGSGRLLEQFGDIFDIEKINYLGVDLSSLMIDEAKKSYNNKDFLVLDMLSINQIKDRKFDFIFFIASFHHLQTIEERIEVLEKAKNLLKKNGIILMTNWYLNSLINDEKYKNDIIENSENQFGSIDYNIYFSEYARFYHCFSLKELDYLFEKTGFEVIENRAFETNKNFISIIKKIGD